jgi:EmrB/QacA subfamily drug resistance transporter
VSETAPEPALSWGNTRSRWVVAATVGGSAIAFLDSTVVNVALPHIGTALHGDLGAMQWVLDAYLVTLTALLLLGGSLGDLYGRRRIFIIGVLSFGVASLACGAAPTMNALIAFRAVQGAAGALLVPSSLAIISEDFRAEDRARAIGAWSGLSAVAGAIGPFVGGWLVDTYSWRLVFLINPPLAVVVALIAWRHVPDRPGREEAPRPDVWGALTATVGLAALTFGLIRLGTAVDGLAIGAIALGIVTLIAFLVIEARTAHPLMPLGLFRSRQFTGANLVTLSVYTGLGATTFLIVVELQTGLGYSATAAGASLLPVTLLMVLFSARSGQLAQRIGPRIPMTVGPLLVAAGLLLYTRIQPGASYVSAVLPGAIVFGVGIVLLVAPLTATVLASVSADEAGIASGINNAVARLAGLLAVAVLPAAAGITEATPGVGFGPGFATALRMAAALCVVGSVISFFTIRTLARVRPTTQPLSMPCHSSDLTEAEAA